MPVVAHWLPRKKGDLVPLKSFTKDAFESYIVSFVSKGRLPGIAAIVRLIQPPQIHPLVVASTQTQVQL